MYITDLQSVNKVEMKTLGDSYRLEIRARYFNPKWIKGMMEYDYAGAREMDNFVEYLWGWDVSLPEMVSDTDWDRVYDVYVMDKYDLGLKEFFNQNNPYAFQSMSARMLEAARKDYWHPTEEMKSVLAEQYEQSVEEYGVTCCHHTCGNPFLKEYTEGILTGMEPMKTSSGKGGGSSRHPYTYEPSVVGASNQTRTASVGTTMPEVSVEEPTESASEEVAGYVMEDVKDESSASSVSGMPFMGILLVLLMLIVIGVGFWKNR